MTEPRRLFHVSPAINRDSIERHGLDWRRMGGACGIASSVSPEHEGVFLARDRFEVDFFIDMAKRRGVHELDIWEIVADQVPLVESDEGFVYTTQPIPRSQMRLLNG